MKTSRTDNELLRGIAGRDDSCFEELVTRYGTKILNVALRITRNQEDAEEVLQDVFTTVFTKGKTFEQKSQFSSWLYRVAMNSSFMKIRARNRRRTVSLEDLEPQIAASWVGSRSDMHDVDSMSTKHEVRDAIQSAVDKLPEDYRAIFILRDVDGLSNEAVGAVLSLTVPAVKSRLHRSRILMRQYLQPYYLQSTLACCADGAEGLGGCTAVM